MSIDDYVTVNEGKDSVTLTAQIDLKEVEKAGKSIHYVATHLVNDIYDNSTSTGICDWLLGNEYNTHEIHSEPGKGIVQKGQIKYNSFIDGILRPAEKTNYEIVVDETKGTVSVTFKNEGHGDYAKRVAEDALDAMGNYHTYFVSGKKEKPKEEKKEAKKDEDLETKVKDAKGDKKTDTPYETDKKFLAFYQGLKDDPKAVYEQIYLPTIAAHEAAEAEAQKAAEAQADKKAPEVKNLADTRKPLPNLKDGNVKKK